MDFDDEITTVRPLAGAPLRISVDVAACMFEGTLPNDKPVRFGVLAVAGAPGEEWRAALFDEASGRQVELGFDASRRAKLLLVELAALFVHHHNAAAVADDPKVS